MQVQIASRLRYRYPAFPNQLHRLQLELAAEFRRCIHTLQFQKHLISVSTKPAAAHISDLGMRTKLPRRLEELLREAVGGMCTEPNYQESSIEPKVKPQVIEHHPNDPARPDGSKRIAAFDPRPRVALDKASRVR
jgi:hypothetical protein